MPRLLALAVSMAATILVLIVFLTLVSWALGRVYRFMISDVARLQALFNSVTGWLEGHGIVLAGLWADAVSVSWLIRLAQQIASLCQTAVSFSIVVIAFVMLGLLEVDHAIGKLRAWRRGMLGKVLLEGGATSALKLRRYMLVRTLMSVATGVLVSAFAWLSDLPLVVEWGIIAFTLNYIPFVGPLIATVFPTLFAMAHFESLQMAALVFACLNVIQFMGGSYVEPRLAGATLSISPFVVLLSVIFWTFLWGLCGAFIGVPIVIVILTLCEQHSSAHWVGDLLGNIPRDPV